MATKPNKRRTQSPEAQQAETEIPVAPPRPVGRPPDYDPSICEEFLALAAEGKSIAQMCAAIGISRKTFYEWSRSHKEFGDTAERCYELSLAWWEDKGQEGILQGVMNAAAFQFQVKNRFRKDYYDENKVTHTGVDGGPIEVSTSADRLALARWIAFHLSNAAGEQQKVIDLTASEGEAA